MMLTHPHPFQKLGLASQLTPPPSPENIQPVQDAEPSVHQGRLRRSRLPEPLQLVDSSHGKIYDSVLVAVRDKRELKQALPEIQKDTTFLDPTRNSSLAGSVSAPVSPLSSSYSDVKGSLYGLTTSSEFTANKYSDVSRPVSLRLESSANLASSKTATSPSLETDAKDISKKKFIIPDESIKPAEALELTPQQQGECALFPLFSHEPVPTLGPSLSRLEMNYDSVQRQQRPAPVYDKALPPPPPETPSPRTVPSAPLSGYQPAVAESQSLPHTGQVLSMSQSLAGLGLDKPSRDYFSPTEPTHRRVPSATYSAFKSTLPKPEPTYTVTISAPRLTRRFSKLSRHSKESYPADPFDPVSVIPQKSNGVETGAIAYLPRYTNTFAGFCKNAWRMQTNQTDKALNIRNRNSSSYPPSVRCKKCSFEGLLQPAPVRNGGRPGGTMWIPGCHFYTFYGVSFSWQFLFKSHVALGKKSRKGSDCEMSDGLFGCIFCCAKGDGTPVFKGPEALAWHLRLHSGEGNSLDSELEHRYKIVMDREPQDGESFDVLVPPMGGMQTEDDVRA